MGIPTMEEVRDATCDNEREKELFEKVINQLGADWDEVWERPEDYRDASQGVSGFTHYSETMPFAKENIENILHCLQSFGPLEKDRGNPLNWLSWFALMCVIDKVIDYKQTV